MGYPLHSTHVVTKCYSTRLVLFLSFLHHFVGNIVRPFVSPLFKQEVELGFN